ncbi:glycosyltransferase family 4 protein [Chitinophaga solisilvae]|uniref:glycosyltransferase family 4 protein n=1 Tax=Chitinophaga solisilvae TaxID=1233460 RepID=UPI00136FF977|nr:glycosyltransferase family 4 protein [Chitinophaga solisilvae]
MTIIYLHQYFSLPSTAGGTRSYDLAKQFQQQGHRVVFITSSAFLKGMPLSGKWTVTQVEGLELHILQQEYSNKLSFFKRILVFLQFLIAASKRVLHIKGEVVIATSTPITIAIPALVKRWRHKTPFIFEVRDVWPEVPIAMGVIKNKWVVKALNAFERIIYKRAAHIVALSDDMKASILKRTATPAEKITVIPNISEVKRFEAFDPEKKMLTDLLGFRPQRSVLYAGTIGMVNGLRYMLDLAVHTKSIDPEIKYLIIGDGMEKDALLKYAADQQLLDQNVFFLPPVPKSSLPQLYHECTVASSFVIPVPELWANSANKFFDSLAAGKPMLINYRGWQATVLEQENAGIVLAEDVSCINTEARRFTGYINNAALLSAQGLNATRLARANYALNIATQKYLEVIKMSAS